LILKGELKEAKNILEYYTGEDIFLEDIKFMENNLNKSGENKFYDGKEGVSVIFHRRIRYLTINMIFIFFLLSFGYYGLTALIPLIVKVQNTEQIDNQKNENNNIINHLILTNALGMIGYIVASIVSEIKYLGRKNSEISGFVITFTSGLISIIYYKYFSICGGIFSGFYMTLDNFLFNYTEEIYPIKIRYFAIGTILGSSKFGGFVGQFTYTFIYLKINNDNMFYPIYAILVIIVIKTILVFFLPKDNNGSLDSFIEFDEGENYSNNKEIVSENHHKYEENKILIMKND